jgi:hypothetical protein
VPQFLAGKKIEYHTSYAEQQACRAFWNWSDVTPRNYAAGVDSMASAILPQHEREPSNRYDRRLKQAIVRRYVRPIINRYNDFVTREKPTRPQGSTTYQELLADVNGKGLSFDQLVKLSLRSAQINGVSYWLADASTDEQTPTVAAENKANKRGIIRKINAESVIWWRDYEGELIEATILLESRGGVFAWHVTETTTQKIYLKPVNEAKELIISSVDAPEPHTYGGCPLVRIKTILSDCGDSDSQAAPLAEGQKRICNLDSWLFEEIQGATFTTAVFLGVNSEQVKDVAIGPGMALCLPGESGKTPALGKLGADVAQAQSVRDSLSYEIKELYRCAGLSPGNPTEAAQPESGVAKAFAFNEINATCAAMADAMEYAENKIIYLLSSGFNWEYPGDCDYPDDFDAINLSEELDLLMKMQAAGLPKMIENKQIASIGQASFNLSPEEKLSLEDELKKEKKELEVFDKFNHPS